MRRYLSDRLEKARQTGERHAAYDWAANVPGGYSNVQALVYLRGYHDDNKPAVIRSYMAWIRYTKGITNV